MDILGDILLYFKVFYYLGTPLGKIWKVETVCRKVSTQYRVITTLQWNLKIVDVLESVLLCLGTLVK